MEEEKNKYAILCLLNHKNRLGNDIKIWHDYALKNYYFVDPDPIYPKLNELEMQGLICPIESSDGLEPAQKTYQITDKGREDFNVWRDETRHVRLTIHYLNRFRPER